MRLKFIIGILALLLLMVGTASAYTEVPVNFYKAESGDTAPPNTAITAVYDGNKITITATAIDKNIGLPDQFDIQNIFLCLDPKVFDPNTATVSDVSGETWSVDGTKPKLGTIFGDFTPFVGWRGVTTDEYKSGGPIVITYPTNKNVESALASFDGYTIVVKVSWGEKPDYSNWVGGKTSIPEFASIAVPMAAIIGILFIFGRRKQE